MTGRGRWLPAGLAAVVLAVGVTSGAAATRPRPTSPGCRAGQAAVAYRAGGALVRPQPRRAPVPCGVTTGFAGAESHIVVLADGRVVYTPAVLPAGFLGSGAGPAVAADTDANAAPAGLAMTADDGRHWSFVRPYGLTWNPTDHADYVDPRTGRFFFEDYGPIPLASSLGPEQEGPAHIMWTDDGRHWRHTAIAALALPENPHFTSAAAPVGQPGPVGYPDVLYFCANSNVGFTAPVIAYRACFRSLDGGQVWNQVSVLLSSLVPQHRECGASGETFSAVDGYYPQPAPNGDLYLLFACGGHTYLARSTDEGATFPVVYGRSGRPVQLSVPVDNITALGTGPQLRIDPAGTFYLLYPRVSGRALTGLYLRVSRTHGLSWSRPLAIAAPGITGVYRWAAAVGRAGQLAVGYLGHRRGQVGWDAYLTETSDASAPSPLFWAARLNPAHRPVLFGDGIQGAGYMNAPGGVYVAYPFPLGIQPLGPVAAGDDFMGVTFGRGGDVWASFDEDCGPTRTTGQCPAWHDQTRGFAGRLRWP